MENKVICKKVSSMLSLYIDDKVTEQERCFIEEHLSQCKECHKKYVYLKSLIKNLKDSYKQVVELALKKQKLESFSIREHEKFLDNISPYVDNELSALECFEFRKYLIKSKAAQKELKNTYLLQKKLRTAFEKTGKKASFNVASNIMKDIKQTNLQRQTVAISEFLNRRVAKIAILSGLVLFGAYEIGVQTTHSDNVTKPIVLKEKKKVPPVENTTKAEKDYIEF